MTEITNIKEYNWAVSRVEEILAALDANENSEGVCMAELEIELKLLSDLVSDYSKKHFDIGRPSLVEVIQLRMYEMGLTQKEVAELLGVSPARISEYLNGKSEPTLQIAREISRKLNIDPAVVLGV